MRPYVSEEHHDASVLQHGLKLSLGKAVKIKKAKKCRPRAGILLYGNRCAEPVRGVGLI
jgi:hypothetical protein